MAISSRYQELKQRIEELRRNLLPKKFSKIGDYTEETRDRARGYRILAHAEIEAYLEDLATEVIVCKIEEWKKAKKASYILVCFIAAYHSGWTIDETEEPPFGPKSRIQVKDHVTESIDRAAQQYMGGIIKKNNGIKLDNLKAIFLPIGIDFDALDNTWLGTMNSFGENRGIVAHGPKKTHKNIDPKTEHETLKMILSGLKDFDILVGELQRL
jgi:hypothetical protein